MNEKPGRIVFAGGGTGGTIGPGLAIAERLQQIKPGLELGFLCSDRSIDQEMLDRAGVRFTALPARIPTRSPIGAIRFLVAWKASRKASKPMLMGARKVVSLGGFVAPPVVREAHALEKLKRPRTPDTGSKNSTVGIAKRLERAHLAAA